MQCCRMSYHRGTVGTNVIEFGTLASAEYHVGVAI